MYRSLVKRMLDIVIASVALLLLVPVLLPILVVLTIYGKPIFVQQRVGKSGKVFNIYKLRTMTDKRRTADREILKGDSEVTLLGSVLRRTKLDETPQLINILTGDMSIVGPRPCLPSLVAQFNDDGEMRLRVRPGLTGLAQVNGNIHLSWEERWRYDRMYVENLSLLLDLKIVVRTILVVVFGEDSFVKRNLK